MRRLLGPFGGAGRQDVLQAADADVSSGEGRDYAARVSHRKAKKKQGNKRKEEGDAKQGENKVKGLNRRTGVRDRCFTCNSEVPNCP